MNVPCSPPVFRYALAHPLAITNAPSKVVHRLQLTNPHGYIIRTPEHVRCMRLTSFMWQNKRIVTIPLS